MFSPEVKIGAFGFIIFIIWGMFFLLGRLDHAAVELKTKEPEPVNYGLQGCIVIVLFAAIVMVVWAMQAGDQW